jgi:site-specific DNA-adenine methylase
MTQYHGGKQRHALHIARLIEQEQSQHIDLTNTRYTNYIEPFLGMGSVMHQVLDLQLRFESYHGNDVHESLIAMWHERDYITVPKHVSRETWYQFKQSHDDNAEKAVIGFGCSVRGVYFGSYREAPTTQLTKYENEINKRKQLFKRYNVTITCGEYDTIPDYKNSVIYCDPPYRIKAYYFHQSQKGRNMMKFNHDKFQAWCETQVSKNGNIVLVSEQPHAQLHWPMIYHQGDEAVYKVCL